MDPRLKKLKKKKEFRPRVVLLFSKGQVNGRMNRLIPHSTRRQNWEKLPEVAAEFMTTLCNNESQQII